MQINTSNAAIFRGLESLELGIPISSATLFELMLLYLQRSAETLTTLTLLTSNLQYKEVQSIIQIFSHRGLLETVHLQVLCLNTQLVDLLASALPNLRVLNLDITEVSGHGETSNMNTMYTHEEQSKQMVNSLTAFIHVYLAEARDFFSRRFSGRRWRGVHIRIGSFTISEL
jgi:hypothetical protein